MRLGNGLERKEGRKERVRELSWYSYTDIHSGLRKGLNC